MSSQVSVCPQGGGCVCGRRACMVGGMPGGGYGGHVWRGACMVGVGACGGHAWQGTCMARGMCGRGGMHGKGHVCATHAPCHTRPPAPTCGQCADGTHPTGMHSCLCCLFFNKVRNENQIQLSVNFLLLETCEKFMLSHILT